MVCLRGPNQPQRNVSREIAAALSSQPGFNRRRVVHNGVELPEVVTWRRFAVGDEAAAQYTRAPLLHLRLAEVEIERQVPHDEAPADPALERVEAWLWPRARRAAAVSRARSAERRVHMRCVGSRGTSPDRSDAAAR